jgi:membrane protease YdiL (CAAX protease family)
MADVARQDLRWPDEDELRVSWGGRQVFALVAVALGLFVVLSIVLFALGEIDPAFGDEDSDASFIAGYAGTVLLELALVVVAFKLARRPLQETLRLYWFRFPHWTAFWRSFAALFACYGVLFVYGLLVVATDSDLLEPDAQVDENSTLAVIMFGILAIGFAPIAEEFLFRGFLFRGLIPKAGVFGAALVSGLLFGAVHAQIGLIIPFSLVGMILAWAYWTGESLWIPIATHLMFNTISTVYQIADHFS